MTEITVKIKWPYLVLATLLGPALATVVGLTLCAFFPPALFFAVLFATGSLSFGYVSYLILAGPLMTLAHALGEDHPLIHAAIGYGAVWMIPFAHEMGIPFIADPEMVELGQWFGPVWCAFAAAIYNVLSRECVIPEEFIQ